jgi:PncC family amidohydrolase
MGTALTDLAAEVVAIAKDAALTVMTAESCTAGALSTILADAPSSGSVFIGGVVSYAKACKSQVLGVSHELLSARTAVSAEVAASMTTGALHVCPAADVAIAVTCVGGPEPDEDGNPVGLTFIAVQRRGAQPRVRRYDIEEGSSGRIRGQVMERALALLRDELQASA